MKINKIILLIPVLTFAFQTEKAKATLLASLNETACHIHKTVATNAINEIEAEIEKLSRVALGRSGNTALSTIEAELFLKSIPEFHKHNAETGKTFIEKFKSLPNFNSTNSEDKNNPLALDYFKEIMKYNERDLIGTRYLYNQERVIPTEARILEKNDHEVVLSLTHYKKKFDHYYERDVITVRIPLTEGEQAFEQFEVSLEIEGKYNRNGDQTSWNSAFIFRRNSTPRVEMTEGIIRGIDILARLRYMHFSDEMKYEIYAQIKELSELLSHLRSALSSTQNNCVAENKQFKSELSDRLDKAGKSLSPQTVRNIKTYFITQPGK